MSAVGEAVDARFSFDKSREIQALRIYNAGNYGGKLYVTINGLSRRSKWYDGITVSLDVLTKLVNEANEKGW